MIYRPADTGLAELLLDAERHPEEMYIVCFDEMNLARAEHYFAQFISVLEKRRIRLSACTIRRSRGAFIMETPIPRKFPSEEMSFSPVR